MTPYQMRQARQVVEDRLRDMYEELYKDPRLSKEQVLEGLRYLDGVLLDDYEDWVSDYEASLEGSIHE